MHIQTVIPVLNATPLAAFAWEGGRFETDPVTSAQVRRFLAANNYKLCSFIGHQSTVDVFNSLMEFEEGNENRLEMNRVSAELAPGEFAILIAIKGGRFPAEGTVLKTAAEVEAAGYGLFILKRLE